MSSRAARHSINDIVSAVPEGTLINMKMNKNKLGRIQVELLLEMSFVGGNPGQSSDYGFDTKALRKAIKDAIQMGEHSEGLTFCKNSGSIVSVADTSSSSENFNFNENIEFDSEEEIPIN